MKELTIEQKAEAYDKAIKVIKDNLDALNEIAETGAEIVNIQAIKNCFYRAFPELKENKLQGKTALEAIKEEGYEWNAEKKELKNIEPHHSECSCWKRFAR